MPRVLKAYRSATVRRRRADVTAIKYGDWARKRRGYAALAKKYGRKRGAPRGAKSNSYVWKRSLRVLGRR